MKLVVRPDRSIATKRRSQFRTKYNDLGLLYSSTVYYGGRAGDDSGRQGDL